MVRLVRFRRARLHPSRRVARKRDPVKSVVFGRPVSPRPFRVGERLPEFPNRSAMSSPLPRSGKTEIVGFGQTVFTLSC